MLPKFIIIGAMKGGTTSLYHYLAAHPQTAASRMKETDFFKDEKNYSKGLSWYESLFNNESAFCFEASPNYTKAHQFKGVPERISKTIPGVKLIYIVRNPFRRTLSHYVHNYANGRESRSFSEVIRDEGNVYVNTSLYAQQVQEYLKYFKREQLYILSFEDLIGDKKGELERLFKYLGLTASSPLSEEILQKKFHDSSLKKRRSAMEQCLTRNVNNGMLKQILEQLFKPFRTSFKRPGLSTEDKIFLEEIFKEDAQALTKITGRSYNEWFV